MNTPADKKCPTALYVWLVPSENVLEQPGGWRIRMWDTEPFPEATHSAFSAERLNADAWNLIEMFAAPVGMDMASCQESWGTEGEAKYLARQLLFNGRRGREAVNADAEQSEWTKAGTGDNSPTSPLGVDQPTPAAGSNPAAALPYTVNAVAPTAELDCWPSLETAKRDFTLEELWKFGNDQLVASARSHELQAGDLAKQREIHDGYTRSSTATLAAWNNPQVQAVYAILCDSEMPPNKQEHWEGYTARKIVAALSATFTNVIELLRLAHCPACDGSGAIPHQIGEADWALEQCQWCDERQQACGAPTDGSAAK